MKCPNCGKPCGPIEQLKNWRKDNTVKKRQQLLLEIWNGDIPKLRRWAEEVDDGPFYWNQLVWQELKMYCLGNKQVEPQEFEELCIRRGFDAKMHAYLIDTLVKLGLGNKLLNYKVTTETVCSNEKDQQETIELAMKRMTELGRGPFRKGEEVVIGNVTWKFPIRSTSYGGADENLVEERKRE